MNSCYKLIHFEMNVGLKHSNILETFPGVENSWTTKPCWENFNISMSRTSWKLQPLSTQQKVLIRKYQHVGCLFGLKLSEYRIFIILVIGKIRFPGNNTILMDDWWKYQLPNYFEVWWILNIPKSDNLKEFFWIIWTINCISCVGTHQDESNTLDCHSACERLIRQKT